MRLTLKPLLFLLILSLLVSFVFSTASADLSKNESINEENTSATIIIASSLFGEPTTIDVTSYSTKPGVNSRLVYILKNENSYYIQAIVFLANNQVSVWSIDFNYMNLFYLDSVFFNESAPMCALALSVNHTVKRYAAYEYQNRAEHSFSDFSDDVKQLRQSIFDGTLTEEYVNSDYFLSNFPEIDWGMSRDDLITMYGTKRITEVISDVSLPDSDSNTSKEETHSWLESQCYDNYGNLLSYAFFFDSTRGKLNQIIIKLSNKDSLPIYIEELKKTYGEPKKTQSYEAFLPNIQEDEEGDAYYWQLPSTYIVALPTWNIIYRPLF